MNSAEVAATPVSAGTGYSPYAATAVVVANMIGTGVFTSLGFQLLDIQSTFPLLLLWVVGGAAAFCGAVSYAELGAAIPRSGGEYTFLSASTPRRGLVSGWISATIGLRPPRRGGDHIRHVPGIGLPLPFAHMARRGPGGGADRGPRHHIPEFILFQRSFTTVKVVLILVFCVAAVALADPPQPVSLLPAGGDGPSSQRPFAVSLIYVSYAYTGWNAATYLTGEVKDPQRTLPRVLGGGTLLVTVLYVGLNYAFLKAAPMDAMAGRIEVGYVAATHSFGPSGAAIMGVALALLLVSTVSAMVMAGPACCR